MWLPSSGSATRRLLTAVVRVNPSTPSASTVPSLVWGAGAAAGQGGPGGVLGVDGVVLAPPAPVGPVDLGDLDPGLAKVAGDPAP
jgi:hypothetical protein